MHGGRERNTAGQGQDQWNAMEMEFQVGEGAGIGTLLGCCYLRF